MPENKPFRDGVGPFLKWAGGKRLLRHQILSLVGPIRGTYFEPFLGGGAVALSIPSSTRKVLSDTNPDLINTYKEVRDNCKKLQSVLASFPNNRDFYYSIRQWDREANYSDRPSLERAARFIYLNKTGYNGLYRVNSQNQFNVPFGDQPRADYVMRSRLEAVSRFLATRGSDGELLTTLEVSGFSKQIQRAIEGDVIYADPPYIPLSQTSDFVSYQKDGFSLEAQEELGSELLAAVKRGVRVVASNSYTPKTLEIYKDSRFDVRPVEVKRAIGASIPSRSQVTEALIVGQ